MSGTSIGQSGCGASRGGRSSGRASSPPPHRDAACQHQGFELSHSWQSEAPELVGHLVSASADDVKCLGRAPTTPKLAQEQLDPPFRMVRDGDRAFLLLQLWRQLGDQGRRRNDLRCRTHGRLDLGNARRQPTWHLLEPEPLVRVIDEMAISVKQGRRVLVARQLRHIMIIEILHSLATEPMSQSVKRELRRAVFLDDSVSWIGRP